MDEAPNDHTIDALTSPLHGELPLIDSSFDLALYQTLDSSQEAYLLSWPEVPYTKKHPLV